MSSNKELRKSKHAAYEKKQAETGERIIKWIFFVLIVLAICFAIYSATIV